MPREDLQDPLVERLSATPEAETSSAPISKKRKRGTKVQVAPKEGAKKAKSKKAKRDEDDGLDLEAGINTAFANMDNQLVSDYIAQKTRKFESDLSSIELEDKYISGLSLPKLWWDSWLTLFCAANEIQDTTSWDKPRTLDNLPGYLEKFAGNSTKLWSASKKNGAPHTIVVTAAGLRAAEIARIMRKFQTKDATVAKLFAKHIKLQDSVKFLKSTRTGIAVGTPTRLKDLMDDGLWQYSILNQENI